MSVIRRVSALREAFGVDEPTVFILAPSESRPVPAGDTRRGTAWIFRAREDAEAFSAHVRERHRVETVPVLVALRPLAAALAERDLTWVLDPKPVVGYGDPYAFKAPLPQ